MSPQPRALFRFPIAGLEAPPPAVLGAHPPLGISAEGSGFGTPSLSLQPGFLLCLLTLPANTAPSQHCGLVAEPHHVKCRLFACLCKEKPQFSLSLNGEEPSSSLPGSLFLIPHAKHFPADSSGDQMHGRLSHTSQFSRHQLGILRFKSIPTLCTWRQGQIPETKGSAPQARSLVPQVPVCHR